MDISSPSFTQRIKNSLWDLFCISSIVGIWPRYIEPHLVYTTQLTLPLPQLPSALNELKILQISDLHLNSHMSDSFLNKFIKKIEQLKPDLITFTGDFLCYGILNQPERLRDFLCQFKAPHGCYAILGNHDYASFVSINDEGEYDVIKPTASSLGRAFKRIFATTILKSRTTSRALSVEMHQKLVELLAQTPFKLLHNETITIHVNGSLLNITGLGEYMIGKALPKEAFSSYTPQAPGIILLHNPDGMPLLDCFPGNLVLSGHTHGGQVNLPWLWKKFTLLEKMEFKSGLHQFHGKWIYINRGMGSVLPFRWFSPPEILLLTLKQISFDA